MKNFHCRLLSGLDDGAQTLSDTGNMLKRAAESDCESRYEETWAAAGKIAVRYFAESVLI